MEVLLVLTVGALSVCCFLIGARIGQQTAKGEDIELPSINPLEAYRKHEARKEAQREQDKIDTIMRNIERYDGTAQGQEDVPQ